MVYLNIQSLLDKEGKSRYWLVKKLDTDYATVNRICDNISQGIKFDTLDKLTEIFACDFNALFVKEKESDYKKG